MSVFGDFRMRNFFPGMRGGKWRVSYRDPRAPAGKGSPQGIFISLFFKIQENQFHACHYENSKIMRSHETPWKLILGNSWNTVKKSTNDYVRHKKKQLHQLHPQKSKNSPWKWIIGNSSRAIFSASEVYHKSSDLFGAVPIMCLLSCHQAIVAQSALSCSGPTGRSRWTPPTFVATPPGGDPPSRWFDTNKIPLDNFMITR